MLVESLKMPHAARLHVEVFTVKFLGPLEGFLTRFHLDDKKRTAHTEHSRRLGNWLAQVDENLNLTRRGGGSSDSSSN